MPARHKPRAFACPEESLKRKGPDQQFQRERPDPQVPEITSASGAAATRCGLWRVRSTAVRAKVDWYVLVHDKETYRMLGVAQLWMLSTGSSFLIRSFSSAPASSPVAVVYHSMK